MRVRVRVRLIFKIMCAGTGVGAVNFQILGEGAVSVPAPALRGLL